MNPAMYEFENAASAEAALTSRADTPNVVKALLRDPLYQRHAFDAYDGRPLLFGIRMGVFTRDSLPPETNKWDDLIGVCFRQAGIWHVWAYPATTDPGQHYYDSPIKAVGTAVLRPGLYSYKLGYHKGTAAFVQASDVAVWRKPLDPELPTSSETGWFGINIHSTTKDRRYESHEVNRWSAGCQVVQHREHLDVLLGRCAGHSTTPYALLTAVDVWPDYTLLTANTSRSL